LLYFAYVTAAGMLTGPLFALKVLAGMLLPLGCIWFPEALGESTQGHVNRPSHPAFVWFLGWVLMLLPIALAAILWLQDVPLDGSLY
jgi:hypothetical protein